MAQQCLSSKCSQSYNNLENNLTYNLYKKKNNFSSGLVTV